MIKKTTAFNTKLYKHYWSRIPRGRRMEFRHELQRVMDAPPNFIDIPNIGGSFMWAVTPQGHRYWANWCRLLEPEFLS